MTRSFALLAPVSIIAAFCGCAPAQDAGARPLPALVGRTILAGCRQGECRWLRISDMTTTARVGEGELRRLVVRRGTSVHLDGDVPRREREARIDWLAADSVDYAFCSTVRPAYAFERENGGLLVHFLDPFDLAGYQMASAGLYMRFCHDRDRLPDADGLRRMGYRPGTRSEQVEDATLETMTRF